MITKTDNRTLLAVSGTTYDFDFRIDDAAELEVYGIAADGTATELTTGFSISFSAAEEEGTVTFVSEPSTYAEILMLRNKPYTQATDVPILGGFSEADIENALDAIVIQIQQLKEITDYCVKQSLTGEVVTVELPTPEDGKALAWDGTSGAMTNLPVDTAGLEAATDAAVAAKVSAEAAAATAVAAAASIPAKASQAEAEAGIVDNKYTTPLSVAQAIAALAPGLSAKVGTFTRDLTAATGDVAYTGVGFQPKAILLFGAINGSTTGTWGFAAGAAQGAIFRDDGTADETVSASICAYVATGVGAAQNAALKTFDADGFTLTWTKAGLPTGTATMVYLAIA